MERTDLGYYWLLGGLKIRRFIWGAPVCIYDTLLYFAAVALASVILQCPTGYYKTTRMY